MGASGSAGAAGAAPMASGGFSSASAAKSAAPYAASVSNVEGMGFVPRAQPTGGASQFGGMLGSLSNFFGGMGSGMAGQQVMAGGARAYGANLGQSLGSSQGLMYSQPAVAPAGQLSLHQRASASMVPMPTTQPAPSAAPANPGQPTGSGPMVSGVSAPAIQTQAGSYFSPGATAVPDYVGMMMSMAGPSGGGVSVGMPGAPGGGGAGNSQRNAAVGSAIGGAVGMGVGALFGGVGAPIGGMLGSAAGGMIGGSIR